MTKNQRRGSARGRSRRSFLAAAITGATTALAGCGYRPGRGDQKWHNELAFSGSTEQYIRNDLLINVDFESLIAYNQIGPEYDSLEQSGTVEFWSVMTGESRSSVAFDAAVRRVVFGDSVGYAFLEGTESDGDVVVFSLPNPTGSNDTAETNTEIATMSIDQHGTALAGTDDLVYAGKTDGTVRAIGADGTDHWTRQFGSYNVEDLAATQRGVVLSRDSSEGAVVSLYAPDGTRRWEYSESWEDGGYAIATHNYVFLMETFGDENVVVLDIESGDRETELDHRLGGVEEQIVYSPDREAMYALIDTDSRLVKIGLGTPEVKWERTVDGRPATDGDVVFAPAADDGLVAFDETTGDRRWHESAVSVSDVVGVTDDAITLLDKTGGTSLKGVYR